MMKQLNKKDIKNLQSALLKYNIYINVKDRFYLKNNVFFKDKIPIAFLENINQKKEVIPTLKNKLNLPFIIIDKGAIKFIANGELSIVTIDFLVFLSKSVL